MEDALWASPAELMAHPRGQKGYGGPWGYLNRFRNRDFPGVMSRHGRFLRATYPTSSITPDLERRVGAAGSAYGQTELLVLKPLVRMFLNGT